MIIANSDVMYRHLVQGVVDYAIYMLNPDGTVANWNAGAQRAKGYTAEEIVGRHFSCFYSRRGPGRRPAAAWLVHRRPGRQVRGRGLARAQGRHAVLGPRRHRCHP